MKILSLDLKAFGPFTDKRLDLSRGTEGFQVIYGPNEAGKSSALRAIRALFYGIPERTPDAFLHEGGKLRIGACIRHSDGSDLTFQRRKGRAKTLLAEGGEPIEDHALDNFLGGVDEALFIKMFGISYDDLIEGGKEIIAGHGDVGESLFAAALGKGGLRRVLSELNEKADELFRPQAHKKYITIKIGEFQEAKGEMQNASLSSKDWDTHHRNLKEARDQKVYLINQLNDLTAQLHHLRRIHDALPIIGELKETLNKRSTMGDVLILPPEFPEQRRDAMQSLNRSRDDAEKAEKHIQTYRDELGKFQVPANIIAMESVIKELQQRLGSHLKAKGDLSGLYAKKTQLISDAEAVLRDIRPDLTIETAKPIRISTPRRKQINELLAQHGAFAEKQNSASRQIAAIKEKIKQNSDESDLLDLPKNIMELRELHEVILKQGDIEKRLKEARRELQVLDEQAGIELKKLPLWSKGMDSLETLAVPQQETLERFERALADQELKIGRIRMTIATTQSKIKELRADMESLEIAGEIPTEEDLLKARTRRQEGWRLIRRAWIEGASIASEASAFDPSLPLDIAYEKSVEAADETSDRLRREADRVAQKMTWRADLEQHENELADYKTEEGIIDQEMMKIHEEWRSLWLPLEVSPLPPKEMRAWVSSRQNLLLLSERVRNAHLNADLLEQEIEGYKRNLLSVLDTLGETDFPREQSLNVLLSIVGKIIKRHDDTETRRDYLRKNLKGLRSQFEDAIQEQYDADAEMTRWKTKWEGALREIGCDTTIGFSSVSAYIERVQELFEKADEAEKLSDRIMAIERDAKRFSDDVSAITATVAPDLSVVTAEHAASVLGERLEEARRNEVRQNGLLRQISEKEQALQEANDIQRNSATLLDHLRDQAKCSSYDELAELERRSGEALTLDNAIRQMEKQLIAYVAGGTIANLIEEAAGINPDELPSRIDQIEADVEEVRNRVSVVDQKIGGEEKELVRMDGGSGTAEAAEKAQSILVQLREGVERYVHLKLAAQILRDEIEKYRSQHQGPVLKRAGELFSAITLGSFSGLKTDFGSDDKPILFGVRPDGKETGVEGMSDGTSDQLYLALRLASLELQIRATEPMPFIVDDILVNFDDERSAATLKILAELSRKTQVIFFTHHQHLVQLAQKAIDPSVLYVHGL